MAGGPSVGPQKARSQAVGAIEYCRAMEMFRELSLVHCVQSRGWSLRPREVLGPRGQQFKWKQKVEK